MKTWLFILCIIPFSILAKEPYFPSKYEEARDRFRSTARKHSDAQLGHFLVPSKIDQDLTIDHLYLPPKGEPYALVILTSGVHGVEAFAGSALQFLFFDEILPKLSRQNLGLLLIHSMNPYGYKYLRRVTENNVDLNRNFGVNDRHFRTFNAGYSEVEGLLNPKKPLSLSSFSYYFSFVEIVWQIIKKSMKPLRQAVLQGQYQYPKGLYFGGSDFEPQNIPVGKYIKKIAAPYKKVMVLDVHTGYGENGKLHLFGITNPSKEIQRHIDAVFAGYKVDTGSDEDFYTVLGDYTQFVGHLVAKNTIFLPMTLEFGTLDSQTTLGALKSISNMIVENQGFHHGYNSDKDRTRVRDRMQEMYYPNNPVWRKKVIEQSRELLPKTINRFQTLK